MSRKPVVAVVGATGQVGTVMRRLLDERLGVARTPSLKMPQPLI